MEKGNAGAAIARCGSVWVFLVGMSLAFMCYGIDWAWYPIVDVTVTEAYVFGSLCIAFFGPFSLLISYGATSGNTMMLKVGGVFGMLSSILCMTGFGYWVWWTVAGRGIYFADNTRYDMRSQVVDNLAYSIDVFFFVAMCTFGGTTGAAAKLAQSLEAEKFEDIREAQKTEHNVESTEKKAEDAAEVVNAV